MHMSKKHYIIMDIGQRFILAILDMKGILKLVTIADIYSVKVS